MTAVAIQPVSCQPRVHRDHSRDAAGLAVASKSVQERVYPEVAFGGFARCDNQVAFFSRVQALAMDARTILNVGCGRGAGAEDPSRYRAKLHDLRGEGRRVIGIDVDPAAAANPLVDEFRLIEEPKSWPVESKSIDLAVVDYVLEHVERPREFFEELHRTLKPGGVACMRTPNRWSYVSMLARLIPNRMHARVVSKAQDGREEQDVFPTFYRCNTKRALRRFVKGLSFDHVAYAIEVTPAYLAFSPLLYRIGAIVHAILPPVFRSTLLIFLRRHVSAPEARIAEAMRPVA